MKRDQSGTFLSAVFVDYDNVYLSLRRKSEEAARRFAKDAMGWLKQIETGALITPTNGMALPGQRRMVMNRCYGNPVPRRNPSDNSTDMSSFPFVRHHFLRAGFEVIDCPPLTAQLKNSADIRMVMDLRDYLGHETHFDEFIILSGDADFTPVLHRLRAHARRTVIYATEYTAVPYTAISDGEVREIDLIAMLTDGRASIGDTPAETASAPAQPSLSAAVPTQSLETTRRAILDEVTAAVRSSNAPVPLEVLADRAVRMVGHERTIGTGWAGAGGFLELLSQGLPNGLRLSGEPPYVVIDTQRHIAQPASQQPIPQQPPAPSQALVPSAVAPPQQRTLASPIQPALDISEPRADHSPSPQARETAQTRDPVAGRDAIAGRDITAENRAFANLGMLRTPETNQPVAQSTSVQASGAAIAPPVRRSPPEASVQTAKAEAQPVLPATILSPRQQLTADPSPPAQQQVIAQPQPPSSIQASIARIHDACKAPPLAPPEYRLLFEIITLEINENGLLGAQTIQNITARAQERGIDVRRDDVRFVLEVVSEADPWFEQGASANLFAGRFRNFVVARCRAQGLTLSADELDLVEAWFAGSGLQAAAPQRQAPPAAPSFAPPAPPARTPLQNTEASYWAGLEDARQQAPELRGRSQPAGTDTGEIVGDDFPRIVRARLRG
jgi:hypothetical protein